MPVNGAYNFKRAAKADATGLVTDENHIGIGEWAWIKFKIEDEENGKKVEKDYLLIYLRDPDCRHLCTLWRRFGVEVKGHAIDGQGHVSPSVLHNWPYGDPPVERCGFHSIPTQLLDFVDIR